MYQFYNPYSNQIAGKMVNDFNQIMPSDIPMDGSNATFIKNDLSEIQLRAWNGNGQIGSITYKPVLDNKVVKVDNLPQSDLKAQNEALESVIALFNERLDKLEILLKGSVENDAE